MLDDFEGYHKTFGNRVFHYLGISLITIAALGFLERIPPIHEAPHAPGWGAVLLGATFATDLLVCRPYALPVLVIGGAFLAASRPLGVPALAVLFVLGWFLQLAGHRFAERNKPAFVDNLRHLYVGPRWMVGQWLAPMGFRPYEGRHLSVSTDLADLVRLALAAILAPAGSLARRLVRRRILARPGAQTRLREIYEVQGNPVRAYTEELRTRIIELQKRLPGSVFIYTSGSTSRPKQILYDRERLAMFKRSSALSAIQIFDFLKVSTPSIFVFASLKSDDSFASLVVSQRPGMPGFVTGITEPARFLSHPLVGRLVEAYGPNAARLWVICLSDPALLYATNPSTLAVFLEEAAGEWPRYRAMFEDFVGSRGAFAGAATEREWTRLILRLGRGGYGDRARALARSRAFPEFSAIAPSLKGYVCWDGGYVTAFLGRVTRYLPPERYFHVPMFSMSTETLQTQTYVHQGRFVFVPLAERVLFEFYPLDPRAEDVQPSGENLLLSHELEPGRSYGMVVSDPWGLTRYDTQDVFLCRGLVEGQPDLVFSRRRGIQYSFTGEKLTGEQVLEAVGVLTREHAWLGGHSIQFTLVPSRPEGPEGQEPHYVLLMAGVGLSGAGLDLAALSSRFDAILGGINGEYRDKRESRRLGPVRAVFRDYESVARRLSRDGSWESQFKLTPITQRSWQEIGLE